MIIRASKIILIAALAFNFTLVATNNILDYDSNYQFVHHVLSMSTTFSGNNLMWRAVESPAIHTIFYIFIILWELTTAIVLWAGAARCFKARGMDAGAFNASKKLAIVGMTLSLLLWFSAFITVGGEWFLMWQSSQWNGESAAWRSFVMTGVILLFLNMDDKELASVSSKKEEIK